MESKEFPSFNDFAPFKLTEAEIACNPVTSTYAFCLVEHFALTQEWWTVFVIPSNTHETSESNFKDVNGNDKTLSHQDLSFPNKLKEGIKKNEQGHNGVSFPFMERPHMLDNEKLAEVQLSHIRRKFFIDERYKEDCVCPFWLLCQLWRIQP